MFSIMSGRALGKLWNKELSYSIIIQITQFWTRKLRSPLKFYAVTRSHTLVDNMLRAHKRPVITDHRYKQSDLQGYRAVQCKSNDKHYVATTYSTYWPSHWENTMYSTNLRWFNGSCRKSVLLCWKSLKTDAQLSMSLAKICCWFPQRHYRFHMQVVWFTSTNVCSTMTRRKKPENVYISGTWQ